jgi:NADPH:quinone reductase-like Zn-dependent oxidoreductase
VDEVRIQVHASGVHLIDTKLRRGVKMGPLPLPELPAIPGREVSGVVDRVGPGVDDAWIGRQGRTAPRGCYELVISRGSVSRRLLPDGSRKPQSIP